MSKFQSLLLLILFLGIGLNAETRYFRRLEIDSTYSVIGRYEISVTESKKVNSYKFIYQDGDLSSVEFLRSGYSISDPYFGVTKINFYYTGDTVKWVFSDGKGGKTSDDNSIFSYRVKYSGNGQPISVFFYDNLDQLVIGQNRIAALHFENNENIRLEYAFNHRGEHIPYENGVEIKKYEFDSQGKVINLTFLDENRNKVLCYSENYSRVNYIYDDNKLIEETFYNKENKLTSNKKGVAKIMYAWDEWGNLIEQLNYDSNLELVEFGEESAIISWDYDSKGNKIKESHFDRNGNPSIDMSGISIYEWTHYEQGNELEQRNYDIYGNLDLDDDGFASYRWVYDDRGNILEAMYYDEEDKLKANKWGIAKYVWEFDSIGRRVKTINYGSYDDITPNEDGVSIISYRYDERNNLISKKNYNGKNQLVLDNNGIAQYLYTYNDNNILVEIRQLGTLGQLKADLDFVAVYQRTYDSMGNLTEEQFLGIDEDLVENRNGIAFLRKRFLRDGSQVEYKKYTRNRIIVKE